MSTYIKINELVKGPYQDYEIENKLRNGEIAAATPAWRMGFPEWTTAGALFPEVKAPSPPPPPKPAASPPPLPAVPKPAAQADDDGKTFEDFKEAHAFMKELFDSVQPPTYQDDALERLPELAQGFLNPLEGRLGQTARPKVGFYGNCAVTKGI